MRMKFWLIPNNIQYWLISIKIICYDFNSEEDWNRVFKMNRGLPCCSWNVLFTYPGIFYLLGRYKQWDIFNFIDMLAVRTSLISPFETGSHYHHGNPYIPSHSIVCIAFLTFWCNILLVYVFTVGPSVPSLPHSWYKLHKAFVCLFTAESRSPSPHHTLK